MKKFAVFKKKKGSIICSITRHDRSYGIWADISTSSG